MSIAKGLKKSFGLGITSVSINIRLLWSYRVWLRLRRTVTL